MSEKKRGNVGQRLFTDAITPDVVRENGREGGGGLLDSASRDNLDDFVSPISRGSLASNASYADHRNTTSVSPPEAPVLSAVPARGEPGSLSKLRKSLQSMDLRNRRLSVPCSPLPGAPFRDAPTFRQRLRKKTLEDISVAWHPQPRGFEELPRANLVGPQWLREAVSKEKIRLETADGYSLDLAYITKNIIAMGFPSSGIHGIYRNHFKDVKSYLKSRHGHKYKLWNLCIERRYDPRIYDNRVDEFPFIDHNPPPLEYFFPFCVSVDKWLSTDRDNVAVIHCKAGKGRTGVMIIVYLMFKYHMTFEEGLLHYGKMRTKDLKGVTLPSQKRFIRYFGDLYGHALNYEKLEIPKVMVYIQSIRIRSPPAWMGDDKARGLCIKIWDNYWRKPKSYKLKECTRATKSKDKKDAIEFFEYDLPGDGIPLTNEVKIEFYKYKQFSKKVEKFRLWFHASFLTKKRMKLGKNDLDGCHKDPKNKKYAADFRVELKFGPPTTSKKPNVCLRGEIHEAPIDFATLPLSSDLWPEDDGGVPSWASDASRQMREAREKEVETDVTLVASAAPAVATKERGE
eukprot:g130.t1